MQIIGDILTILVLAFLVLFLFRQVRVSPVVGFLLIGLLTGPQGTGLIREIHNVERLCEAGVVLLLFSIGLELSMENLWRFRKSLVIGGSFQVFVTLAVTSFVAFHLGETLGRSIFLGFLASFGSAAVALKLLQQIGDGPQSEATMTMLIFQGLIAVPMVFLLPFFSEEPSFEILLWSLLKGVALIAAAIAGARCFFPPLLQLIESMQNRELLDLSLVVVGLVTASLASVTGLSPPMSAFLAGIVLSGAGLGREAMSKVMVFRDVFASFFFISIGMLADPKVFVSHAGTIALLVLGVMVLKTIAGGVAATVLGYPPHAAAMTALVLSPVGEFSFILSKTGVDHGLLPGSSYQVFLALSILTMAMAPFTVNLTPWVGGLLMRLPAPSRLQSGFEERKDVEVPMPEADLLIIGYGASGRDVADSVEDAGIAYTVIDIDPRAVESGKEKGQPVFQGDATQRSVLEKAGVGHARVVVITVSHLDTARGVLTLVRNLSPKAYIIVRVRTLSEVAQLYDLGANRVVSDEFEASLGIFSRVLSIFWDEPERVNRFIAETRSTHYGMLRCLSDDAMSLFISSFDALDLHSKDTEIWVLHLKKDSPLEGKSWGQVRLEENYRVALLGVCADSQILTNPGADAMFSGGSIYVLAGEPDNLARVRGLFEA